MPRREQPLERDGTALVEFAADLRELRNKAGAPTYRELAKSTHYSTSALWEAAGGKRLPTLEVTLAYVQACGGDTEQWRKRWREIAANTAPQDNTGSPYVGLAAYGTNDADRFFGRERLVDDLVQRLDRQRFLAVFGPSGSGKSSLLRAGLIPRLTGRVELITPGARPPEQWDADVLVVDQFEEVFTLTRDTDVRNRFIDALLDADCKVVIGVRADFYAHCSVHTRLVEAIQDAQVTVGPMTADELRRAIATPATRAQCTIENALLTALVAEAHGRPGVLPLLSHALRETWRRRKGNTLTLSGFQAVGGIDGALAKTAESVFLSFDHDQQRVTKDLFRRLIVPGEGTEDTRRRVSTDELTAGIEPVLERLATARLITLDHNTVEIAHEALIRSWRRLGDWLDEDRHGLRVQRQLTEAAEAWRSVQRDPGALYRGTRLTLAQDWASRDDVVLSALELEFLQHSVKAQANERRTTQRRTRQLRWLTAGLSVLLVIATSISIFAARQQQEATARSREATSRQLAAEADGLATTDVARAIHLSIAAYQLDPTTEARSALIRLASNPSYHRRFDSPRNLSILAATQRVLAYPYNNDAVLIDLETMKETRRIPATDDTAAYVLALAFSPDGNTLATYTTDGKLLLTDVATGARKASASTSRTGFQQLTFSPDGRTLARSGEGREVTLVDTNGAQIGVVRTDESSVRDTAFSPDGKTLITSGDSGRITMWSVQDGSHVATLPGAHAGLFDFTTSPDGTLLAAASADGTVPVWDLRSRQLLATLPGHNGAAFSVAFSPDGTTLVSTGKDANAILWNVPERSRLATLPTGESQLSDVVVTDRGDIISASSNGVVAWHAAELPFIGSTGAVRSVAFSGDRVVAVTESGVLNTWHERTPNQPSSRTKVAENLNGVSIEFGPRGRLMVLNRAPQAELWQVSDEPRRIGVLPAEMSTRATISPDEQTVAMLTDQDDLALWSVPNGKVTSTVNDVGRLTALEYNATGDRLAGVSFDGVIKIWDTATGAVTATMHPDVQTVRSIAFSPDGRRLVTAAIDGTLIFWNLADRTVLAWLKPHSGDVRSVAYSHDGRFLVTAGDDKSVIVWNAEDMTVWAKLAAGVGPTARWHPRDHVLIVSSSDHTIRRWNVDPEPAIRNLCRQLFQMQPGPPSSC